MNLQAAIQSLKEHWQRALLSSIGIAVASIAIILLISIGIGVQKDITSEVEQLGADVLVVVPGKVNLQTMNPNIGGKSFLNQNHAKELKQLKHIKNVAQWSFAGGGISYKGEEAYPFIIATSPEWFKINKMEFQEGKPFTPETDQSNSIVLGSVAKEIMFGTDPALGKEVTVNNQSYQVIGVIKQNKSNSNMFSLQSLSNVAYLPLTQIRKTQESVQLDRLLIQFDNQKANPDELIPAINQTLEKTLSDQQFSVLTQEDLLGLIYQVFGILSTLVIGLTSIALFVGGMGIMTVMLMAVNERTSEIGVRKTTGAKRKDIFAQFLYEAVFISITGVIIGLIVSGIAILIITKTTPVHPMLTAGTLATAFLVSIGLGTLFGVIPAIKASKLDPVEALRRANS